MNFFAESTHFSMVGEALGMTILHSLWQGALLMVVLALFLRLGKSASSGTRFTVAFASLLIFLGAFALTFYQQWESRTPAPIITLPAELPTEDIIIDPSILKSIPTEPITEVETNQWEVWRTQLSKLAPWLAWLWVVGSIVFGLRLINGLVQSQRLRYRTQPIPANWQQRAEKLIQQLGISQSVSLASSNRTNTPLTLGWLRPIVLIPTSLLVMMPADQLEAILIHELAHIKRRDYLWNLIQSIAEVVLFYHPAYWYMASVLERERELACDALTVTVTQQPRIYAQALLQVATQSAQVPLPSVAAAGKRGLSNRIQQIIYPGKVQRGISVLPFVLLLSLISLSLAAFSWYQPSLNRQDDSLADNASYEPIFTTQDGYGAVDSLFLEPLDQPNAGPIDYGPTFQEVMNGLSDEFLDTINLTVDEMYQQAVTIDQALNRLSRSAARLRGDSLAESPVNYSAPSVVYLLDNEVVDPKQVKRFAAKSIEVFRAPFPAELQNLVDREYSLVVRAISRKNKLDNAQGNLRRPDYIGHGYFASQTMPLFRHLYFISNDGYLVGQNDFSQQDIDPNKFFRNSTLYMLDDEVVGDPGSIILNAVRRYEVYYAPLPTALQNLAAQEYSAVVRAFSREYQQTDLRPFGIGGQVITRQEGNYQPISGIKVEIEESGEQTITNEIGKFWLPATPEGTLVFNLPDQSPIELAIDGREFFNVITSTRKQRLSKYRERLREQLAPRMSETALEKDKKAIQQQINALDKAINSLQRGDTVNTLTKTITGRVVDAFANQGIEGVLIEATDGTISVTDEKGYYKIFLPIYTTDTEFEFTHPDYPTQQMKIDAGEQKAVYLSMFKAEDRLIIQGERTEQSAIDSTVYDVVQGKFLYDPTNNAMRVLTEEELQENSIDKTGLYSIDDSEVLFTLNGAEADPRSVQMSSIAYLKYDNLSVPEGYKVVIRAFSKDVMHPGKYNTDESLYVIDDVPQENLRDLWSLDPKEIASVQVLKVNSNPVSRFEGLPIEGKDQVIYVTTKSTASSNSPQGKSDNIDLTNFRVLDPANEPPLFVINGVIQTNEKSINVLDPDNITSIETMKGDEAQIWFGKQAMGGAVLIRTKDAPSPKVIEGKVFSGDTRSPLSGVTVSVKGKKLAVSDRNGNYRSEIPNYSSKIILSKDGYETIRPISDGYPSWSEKLYMRPVPSSEEISTLHQKYIVQEVPRTAYSVNNALYTQGNPFPKLRLADIQSIRVIESKNMPEHFREKFDRIVSITTQDAYQYTYPSFSNVNALYVIDGVPQKSRTNLSNISSEDIISTEIVRIKDNRADQFEGLPIEGKDHVIYVTTRAGLTPKTISGRIIEERSREGIVGVKIKATNGSTAETDSEGYYQIQLPANTQKTTFEFTHPDYPKGEIEAKITGQKLNDLLFIKPEHYQEKRDSIAQIPEVDPVEFSQLQQLDSALHPPLYIIDGVFVDDPLENLDPRSIMNIDVVKGPEAERRYGKKAIGGAILITTKNPSPSKTIEGKVTSAERGEPLPGVSITAEGTNIGTVTDRDGKYSIQVPKGASNLVFSSASSEQKTVSVRGKRIVNVDLTFLSLNDSEHTLFVVDGQVREDINTLDGLNVNYYEIRQETPRLSLPKKYRDKGYTKVVRVVTRGFNAYLGDRAVLGKLVDNDNGEPLVDVEVRWVEDGKKTVLARTDEQGKYQVTLPKEAKIIEYFHPGYTPLVITDRFVTESFPMRLTLSLEKDQIDEAAFENKLKVYPNPGNQNEVRVEFSLEGAANINFYFYSKEGRLVHDFKPLYLLAGDQNVALPTIQFPSDEYLLLMKINDRASFTRRVLLK